jgi:hypothetical protein
VCGRHVAACDCHYKQCAKTLQATEYVCDPESETVKAHAAVPGTTCMAYYPQVTTLYSATTSCCTQYSHDCCKCFYAVYYSILLAVMHMFASVTL